MKSLNKYIQEKLIINKNYNTHTCAPKSFNELREIIEQRYEEQGPGIKQKPIYFNDIDVSNIDSFYNDDNNKGIFKETKFKYIDISDWDVSNVKNMNSMFYGCKELKSIGDLSNWDVSECENMSGMFCGCYKLKQIDISNWKIKKVRIADYMFAGCKSLNSVGDLSNWTVSKIENMEEMFGWCGKLTSIGDISKWDVSNVEIMSYMFCRCQQLESVGDLSNWNISKVKRMNQMFKDSGITNIPKWR